MACSVSVVDVTPAPGSVEMVQGSSFPTAPKIVPILLDNSHQVGLANIDAAGHFIDPIRIPANIAEGRYTISVECGTLPAALQSITVTNVPPPPRNIDDV